MTFEDGEQHGPAASAPLNRRTGFRAYLSVLLVTVTSGSVFFFTVLSLEEYSPQEIAAGKLLIGGVALLLPLVAAGKLSKITLGEFRWILLLGFVGYCVPQIALTWSQQWLDSSMAALFFSSIPLFSLLLVRLVLKEHVSAVKWAGFVIGLLGLLVLINPVEVLRTNSATGLLPYGGLLLTTFSLCASSIIVQKMPRMPVVQTTAIALLTGCALLAPFGLWGAWDVSVGIAREAYYRGGSLNALLGLFILGFFLSGAAQVLRNNTIQLYGSAFFSIVGYLVPIWAALLGVAVLGEELGRGFWIACVLIFTGLHVAQSDAKYQNWTQAARKRLRRGG